VDEAIVAGRRDPDQSASNLSILLKIKAFFNTKHLPRGINRV
jgi:hypothetical protein